MPMSNTMRGLFARVSEGTKEWAKGLSEEASFLRGRVSELWEQPEKLSEAGLLGIIPQMAIENIQGKEDKELYARMAEGDIEAFGEYGMKYGSVAGITRKEAVKTLARDLRELMRFQRGVTDPTTVVIDPAKASAVIREMRKIPDFEAAYGPIKDVGFDLLGSEGKRIRGEYFPPGHRREQTIMFDPRRAAPETVWHEPVHMKQYMMKTAEERAFYEPLLKGRKAFRESPEYAVEKDPFEVQARTVGKYGAKGGFKFEDLWNLSKVALADWMKKGEGL